LIQWIGVSWRVAAVALLLVATAVSTAEAEEAATSRLLGSADIDGFRGRQGIRTNPSTVNGISFVHPVQADVGSLGLSFLAVGTYKGAGTSGHVQDCPDDYTGSWSVYVDGEIGGVYFCDKVLDSAYNAGTNPKFQIEYTFCPSASANRWHLYFGGTLWRCQNSGAVGATRAAAGLETKGTTVDRNIDVKYTELNINRRDGLAWLNFSANDNIADPNYTVNVVSNTAVNVFLAPLD